MGNVCEKFVSPDLTKSQEIHLYTLGCAVDNQLVPLCQMLTEKLTNTLLTRFLYECQRSHLSVPKLVEIDFLRFHIEAVNTVFNNNLPYEEYLDQLTTYYLLEDTTELSVTMIKTDIKCLIMSIMSQDCIKNILLDNVNNFFLCLIVLTSKVKNVQTFKIIVENVFILISSKSKTLLFDESFKTLLSLLNRFELNNKSFNNLISQIDKDLKLMAMELANFKLNQDQCPTVYSFIEIFY